ncbi:pyruvate, water dikinase regulatory protein [Methylomagnum sp.]
MPRPVFFVSDHTGITAETYGRSLLSQFPGLDFERVTLPFTDSEAKVRAACQRIAEAHGQDEPPPLVFSTLADRRLREVLRGSGGLVFDLFDAFIGQLEDALGETSAQAVGRAHGLNGSAHGRERVDALKFTLDTDDGLRAEAYGEADIILVGVSRSGKTPACLYLALQHGVRAANYPLTAEDLEREALPAPLLAHRSRLFGLTMNPERLHRLREERKAGSRYASLGRCREEIRAAVGLFKSAGIPCLDTSNLSVEEIGTRVLHESGLKGKGK